MDKLYFYLIVNSLKEDGSFDLYKHISTGKVDPEHSEWFELNDKTSPFDYTFRHVGKIHLTREGEVTKNYLNILYETFLTEDDEEKARQILDKAIANDIAEAQKILARLNNISNANISKEFKGD